MRADALTTEQNRQLIDAVQLFKVWRDADRQFRQSYRGTLRWRMSKGQHYLYRTEYRSGLEISKSLGPRSPATETLKSDYMAARTRLRQRTQRSATRLKEMARVNRALRLNRVPPIETKILRALDREGLMGGPLFVVGTNALFAYEMRAGQLLSSDLLATSDIDLLRDDRRRLSLVLSAVEAKGVLGILRDVDKSFKPQGARSFRAANDKGYLVDLIRPIEKDLRKPQAEQLSSITDDLFTVGIEGLQWLVHAPKMEETVIGSDGVPVLMSCIDPRAFALHKLWVSERQDRDARQRPRDREQAIAVAALAISHLRMKLDAKELSALPRELRAMAGELTKLAMAWTTAQEDRGES